MIVDGNVSYLFEKGYTIEELLIDRGIDIKKYNKITTSSISRNGKERIKLYIRFFIVSDKEIESYYGISGIVDNQKRSHAPSNLFDVIYYSTTVEKNAWLLLEEYLKDFASPNIRLKNREGITNKFYVSPRKYIVPAKVNIKLESINYSAWVPFGFCEKYPTFEEAKEEIKQRLQNANLPGLKLTFTRETINRK